MVEMCYFFFFRGPRIDRGAEPLRSGTQSLQHSGSAATPLTTGTRRHEVSQGELARRNSVLDPAAFPLPLTLGSERRDVRTARVDLRL